MPPHRRRLGTALLLALALHALALLLAGLLPWREQAVTQPPLAITLRTQPPVVLPAPQRLPLPPAQVRPLPPPAMVPDLPAPVRPADAPSTPAAPTTAPATPAQPVTTAAPAPRAAAEPSPRIAVYGLDGRLKLPASVLEGEPAPVPSWVDAPREAAPWEQRADPLVYEPTAFEPYWKPVDETLLGEFFRRNTRTRTFKLPDGTRVTCSWVLIIGGCGW